MEKIIMIIVILLSQASFCQSQEKQLFKDDFNDLDNWTFNPSKKDIAIIPVNSINGKVVSFTKTRKNGVRFIEKDVTNLVRGKKIKILANVRLTDIKGGDKDYETGKLCLEYIYKSDTVYNAAQNVEGDWRQFDIINVVDDGTKTIDDTKYGDDVIHVPMEVEKARLYLGLQECTGMIFFDWVEILEVY